MPGRKKGRRDGGPRPYGRTGGPGIEDILRGLRWKEKLWSRGVASLSGEEGGV